MIVAVYNNATSKECVLTSPESVIQAIQSDEYKEHIEYLRSLPEKEYKMEKIKMLAVTWCGSFKKGTREIKTIESYSKLVVIDIDNLDETQLPIIKSHLSLDEYVRYLFISPSGKGLKFVVEVNTGAENHRSAFIHLKKYFEEKYLVKVDDSGKDLSRLCFLSWDPKAVINVNSTVFTVDLKYGEITPFNPITVEGQKTITEANKIFEVCVMWVNRTKAYHEGNRNNYIHALACALNRCGVSQEEVIRLFAENYSDLEESERRTTIRSAYFHYQHEHNTVPVREIGSNDFIAPPYIMNYTDDVAANDLMRITASLYTYKVPNNEIMDLVSKVGKFYDGQGYIDLRRASLTDLMNKSIEMLQQNIANNAAQNALAYQQADDILNEMLNYGSEENAISTGLPTLDSEMLGGLLPGNVYGLIGLGETFKSIFAQRITFINALKGIPSLYLNGEMSKGQYYERLVYMVFGIDLRQNIIDKKITKESAADFIERVKAVTGNNLFVYNGSGMDKKQILATLDHIESTTGKKIRILVIDGVTQLDWGKLSEIEATIKNSLVCKDIAKEANNGEGVATIALFHVSGDIVKWKRNTGDNIRGGKKSLANLDAYFCTSRLIDPNTNTLVNAEDMQFLPNKFYLRYVDKRSKMGIVNNVINVGDKIELKVDFNKAESYEIKLEKR